MFIMSIHNCHFNAIHSNSYQASTIHSNHFPVSKLAEFTIQLGRRISGKNVMQVPVMLGKKRRGGSPMEMLDNFTSKPLFPYKQSENKSFVHMTIVGSTISRCTPKVHAKVTRLTCKDEATQTRSLHELNGRCTNTMVEGLVDAKVSKG